jgi:hypothetical protein
VDPDLASERDQGLARIERRLLHPVPDRLGRELELLRQFSTA